MELVQDVIDANGAFDVVVLAGLTLMVSAEGFVSAMVFISSGHSSLGNTPDSGPQCWVRQHGSVCSHL